MTETEARKAFNTASTELQTALAKYQGARTELHRITGKFVGTDPALSLKFSQTFTDTVGGAPTTAQALADC